MFLYINLMAVVVSAITSFVLGWVWYSDPVFGRKRRMLSGISEEAHVEMMGDKKRMLLTMIVHFVSLLLMTFVLARILFYMGAYGVKDGIMTALWMWIGFVVPGLIGMVLWDRKPWAYYFITVGYFLLALCVSGTILMLWR